ncbi:MAG TPA: T9SS type A sorting domain-containing protein [bacterium]|jgi:hypothetical protein
MNAFLQTLVFCCVVVTSVYAQPMNVIWQREGVTDSSHYAGIMPLGDQNDDGYADFLVWAYGVTRPGGTQEGYIEFFHGGNPPDTVPYWTKRANPQTDYILTDAHTNADLNGDGYKDFMLCFEQAEDYHIVRNEIYYGGPQGDTLPDLVFHTGWHLYPRFMGDFNGDGFEDLYFYNNYEPNNDYAEIFYGGSPMDSLPDWIRHSPAGIPQEVLALGFGDIDGDHFADFITNPLSPQPSFRIFRGSSQPDTFPDQIWPNFDAIQPAVINDLNGDGRAEVCMPHDSLIDVYFGGDSLPHAANATLVFAAFALDIHSAGDINGDGFNDFFARDDLAGWGGYASLYLGHPDLYRYPLLSVTGHQTPLNLPGVSMVTGLGDVNGDGVDDFGVGGISGNNDGQRGKAVIVAGNRDWHAAADDPVILPPSSFRLSVFPNPFNGTATINLTLPDFTELVDLNLYNIAGQSVYHQVVKVTSLQMHLRLNATDLSTGVYFLRATARKQSATTKLLLLK